MVKLTLVIKDHMNNVYSLNTFLFKTIFIIINIVQQATVLDKI